MYTYLDALNKTKNLSFPVGEDENGKILCTDLISISHMMISGATGTGKSVFLHTVLSALLSQNSPNMLRILICDTKIVEFCAYNGLPHLLSPVVTDPQKIVTLLDWANFEIKKRLNVMASEKIKSISSYNDHAWESFEDELPRIVIVLDDFSSVLLSSPEAEDKIKNIILYGRSTGVHLIAVSQTPTWKRAKQISLLFTTKVLFSASSANQSKLLIGKRGAETLGPCGEAFFSQNGAIPVRIKTIMAKENELSDLLGKVRLSCPPQYEESVFENIEASIVASDKMNDWEDDELLPHAIDVVVDTGIASVSMLQRQLKLGYSRAARLVDQMEERGIVGPFDGSKPRQVLVTKEQWAAQKLGTVLAEDDSKMISADVDTTPKISGNPNVDFSIDGNNISENTILANDANSESDVTKENTIKHHTTKITIQRLNQILGCALTYNVSIDGSHIGNLPVNKSVSGTITEGTHRFSFSCPGKSDTSFWVDIKDEEEIKFFIKVGLKWKVKLYR